ncbi:hypothetical protein JCM3770_004046 [Rhodotorula araucariae]
MARDGPSSAQTAINGSTPGTLAQHGPPAAPGPHTASADPTPAAQAEPQRARIADKHVDVLSLMSLPARDLPSYYDPPSSPSDASDAEFDRVAHPATSFVPTTNRGHKLSRLAPHTRRGRLGHHANVDAGFIDETTSTSLVPPAQKRRKLNDLATASSSAGFAVAPNLHLVPRGVHTLSREPDAPAQAYLAPVPQSPLDLLLTPAVQHTLGRKNNMFHLLAASATSLIEQEAELVGALSRVCRGLRGEGFDWRWEGDEERRKEREERREREERERERKALEAKREEDEKQLALQEAAAAAEARAQAQATPAADGMAVDAAEKEASPAVTAASVVADDVKLEQATPVLSAPSAPGTVVNPVAVPGLSAPGSEAPAPTTGENREQPAEAPAASSAVNGAPQDVAMQDATDGYSAAGYAGALPGANGESVAPAEGAQPATNGAGVAPSAGATPAPVAAAAAPGDVPVIAVTGVGTEDGTPIASGALGAAEQAALAAPAGLAAAAGPSAEAHPVVEGAVLPADVDAPSAEVTPAPSASDEPRRRSGRVVRGGGAGAVAGRHTRSRQSSPEEGYTDEEDEAGGDGASSGDEPLAAGRAGGGGGAARGAIVEEEEMPDYAARLIDPEVFVRGLFVSEGDVEMERVVPGPGGGMIGTGQMETLTPNEQEVLLHDCLTDLHRFLADTLEYRSRLLEIRDGALGVERRRKGMWKCVRTVAMDWLQEEGAGMGGGDVYE